MGNVLCKKIKNKKNSDSDSASEHIITAENKRAHLLTVYYKTGALQELCPEETLIPP